MLNYWPSNEEINRCIKAEAENASDEVLLAVHQPFPLAYFKVGPDGKVMPDSRVVANEDDILKYFLGDAPSGCHVLPITGGSGVGKSHLIRMIDARLSRLSNSDQYLVIRIPKSASLRRVVSLILEAEPLKNHRYDRIKEEFSKALAEVSLDVAVIRFQAELAIALNEYSLKLKEELSQDPANASIKERYGHAAGLPNLMADAETVDHFRNNVLPRIIQRSVKGAETEDGELKEIDSTSVQFKVEDLDLSQLDIGSANTRVAKYYTLALNARDGKGKAIAVQVLNDVVDQATSRLYQLNGSLGGMTLGEVILEIRRLLVADNKDLVILVEDFAALVGIQDTLAKVLIQEGETSKGKEYATIRSAIAVTDGYLAGRDTLATRAGREWVVESRLESESEILSRTKSLVASYLNAARIGEVALKHHYQKIRESEGALNPPIYSDDDSANRKHLLAFGYDGDIPLFPFSENSIEFFARAALTSGNSLVYNPRYIIKNVIREVLMVGREAFVNKQFPPPSLVTKIPSSDVAQWISSLPVSEDQRKRYQRLITAWGNDPKERSEIGQIQREVFEVFGLPQPDIQYSPPAYVPSATQDSYQSIQKVDVSRQEQLIKTYHSNLEDWVRSGKKLDQKLANEIRNNLATLINQRIDWNAERCIKQEFTRNHFSISNASGDGSVVAEAIQLAPNSDDEDGSLRAEVIALLRSFTVFKDVSDYEGIDEDIARISNLYERLSPAALEIIRSSVKKQNKSALLSLSANSRLLGINDRGRTPIALADFLFGEVDPIELLPETSPPSFKEWKLLQVRAELIRSQLMQVTISANGCFQGAGKTAHGIDIIRMLEDYPRDEEEAINFGDFYFLPTDLKPALQDTREAVVVGRMGKLLQEVHRIQQIITHEIGVEFDKQEVVSVFKELAGKVTSEGLWGNSDIGTTSSQYLKICEEFRSSPLKETLSGLRVVEEVNGEKSNSKKIIKVAQLPLIPLLTSEIFINYSNNLIKVAENQAQTLEAQYEGISAADKADQILLEFNTLVSSLLSLQSGDQ